MLTNIIKFSLNNKLIIFLFTAFIVGFGIFSLSQIPIGAVPDITNNQVQVITTSRNLSTQDVEQFITYPVELEMANLPGVEEIRSTSKFGLSVVTIVFNDNLGTFLPRQLIAEKIKSATEQIELLVIVRFLEFCSRLGRKGLQFRSPHSDAANASKHQKRNYNANVFSPKLIQKLIVNIPKMKEIMAMRAEVRTLAP